LAEALKKIDFRAKDKFYQCTWVKPL